MHSRFGLPRLFWRAVVLAVLAMVLVLGASLLFHWNPSLQFWAILLVGVAVYLVAVLVPFKK